MEMTRARRCCFGPPKWRIQAWMGVRVGDHPLRDGRLLSFLSRLPALLRPKRLEPRRLLSTTRSAIARRVTRTRSRDLGASRIQL